MIEIDSLDNAMRTALAASGDRTPTTTTYTDGKVSITFDQKGLLTHPLIGRRVCSAVPHTVSESAKFWKKVEGNF